MDFEELADKENVTPADYAVEVTGIPMDARDEVRPAAFVPATADCDASETEI